MELVQSKTTFRWRPSQTSPHASLLGIVLFAVVFLNILDALFTMFWIQRQLATEANPLMAYLLDLSPFHFFAGKMLLVGLGCLLLWRCQKSIFALFSSVSVLFVYMGIIVYHLHAFTQYLA